VAVAGPVAAKRLAGWSREGEFEVVLIDRSPWHEYRPPGARVLS
jgi:hypothetical protein